MSEIVLILTMCFVKKVSFKSRLLIALCFKLKRICYQRMLAIV